MYSGYRYSLLYLLSVKPIYSIQQYDVTNALDNNSVQMSMSMKYLYSANEQTEQTD